MKTWLYDFLKPLVRAYYFLVRGIRATGTENVASPGGYILCSNHVSASDPFVLATCVRRRLHFMAKAELFNLRFQLATGQLQNTTVIASTKRDIARCMTILREQELKDAR